jgi:ABC-type multidrug transport system ATPase subunit
MDALLLADSFVKSFGRKRVLTSATIWARAGRITVVMGLNGSGKTTLIRSALGLERAEQGIVRYQGEVFLRPRLWRLAARGLFYLPDRGLLSRRMRMKDQLELIRTRFGGEKREDVLARLEVDGSLDALPGEMSGGELRRAELALALIRRPTCLIADEPLTEIEPRDRGLIMAVLRAEAASGTAVLVTGHEVGDLLSLSDEVIWLAAGTTHGLGSPDQARAHDQFRREYLGPRAG